MIITFDGRICDSEFAIFLREFSGRSCSQFSILFQISYLMLEKHHADNNKHENFSNLLQIGVNILSLLPLSFSYSLKIVYENHITSVRVSNLLHNHTPLQFSP